jgi:transposase
MVWGGVKERGRTLLVVDAGYLTGRRYAIPFIQTQANNVTFQQDNARPHVARVVRDYLTQQNVDVLPWPAISSDLSSIEHVWGEMERRLRHLLNQPVTLADMGSALIRIWNNIPEAFLTH